jgi:hypothetical protein|tara:strand:+ start:102 stop:386 length:285 start_codon:yes stop_codon:yes gene_type:complete
MNKIVNMLKGGLVKQTIKPVSELLNSVLELFKDTKGKYSSKRTISGVLVLAASADISLNGITTMNLGLSLLAILPLLFSVFEKNSCNCDCALKK